MLSLVKIYSMKTHLKLRLHKLFILFYASLILISCKKDDNSAQPSLTSINPAEAGYNDSIIITGKNFGSNPEVTINDKKLTVVKVDNNTLKVTIPKMLGSGPVNVSVGGKQYSGPNFSYKYKATVTTIAGSGEIGNADGVGLSSSFNCPWGITVNNDGDLFVADSYNRLIRKISAGDRSVSSIQIPSIINGKNFYSPYNITLGNNQQDLYVTDFNNHILKIDAKKESTVIYNGTMPTTGIVMGKDGFLYITNNTKGTVMKLSTDGKDSLIVAQGLVTPRSILFDKSNTLYVAAYDISSASSGIYKIENTGAVKAEIKSQNLGGWEVAIDSEGNFYNADHVNNCIKIIEKNGRIVKIAGNGQPKDVDGIGLNASFDGPTGITIDHEGNLYVTTYNFEKKTGNKVRKITIE